MCSLLSVSHGAIEMTVIVISSSSSIVAVVVVDVVVFRVERPTGSV